MAGPALLQPGHQGGAGADPRHGPPAHRPALSQGPQGVVAGGRAQLTQEDC